MHEIAKGLNVPIVMVVNIAKECGLEYSSHMQIVNHNDLKKIMEYIYNICIK